MIFSVDMPTACSYVLSEGFFCETIPLRTMMPFRMMPFRRLSLFALLLAAGLLTAVPATQAQPSSSASDVAEAPPTSNDT